MTKLVTRVGGFILSALVFLCAVNFSYALLNGPQKHVEAIQFFSDEGDPDNLKKIVEIAKENFFSNQQITSKIFDLFVKQKNRKELVEHYDFFKLKNSCSIRKSGYCVWLASVWSGHLDSIFFYETSPVKVVDIRGLVHEAKCAQAQNELNQLLEKEGENLILTTLSQTVKGCEAKL